ncbi:Similar to ph-p: Polyhomeotic-proximal chromatin protein (Drosophila melanogaster) [Cotesia congregata]|uniref:Similar to ph-p: Polyhomeotic-proximal chromatin protein (Drosophila melanogaster) n=1 Tax=Cotesia congregata TaxID=51543 RepID=A0A8J2H7K6_COTCN|nr:Similar to ph-p: Polyhomeotic-proximal chromatin protein (Drosophila melanogaster) [Cotesia congregata]
MAAHPQAVQVIQQPMQSGAYHLQQLYNTQGTPMLLPGNLALHSNLNPSSIQVITAGKPFQSAGQLTPHMLTTASTQGQPGGHAGPGGKVQGFPAGYLPVPTSNPGGGQTLVFGPLGVLGSPQPQQSLQQQQQQQGGNKADQYTTCAAGTQNAARGGGMQFAPWQFTPQVAWAGLQPPGTTLLAAPNQIFIRSPTQPEMYIQSPQPIQAHNAIATQQQLQGVQQIAAASGKPRVMDIQQQSQQAGKQGGSGQRPLSILPSSLQGVQGANIRPASSVSTQTVHGVQTTVQTQSGKGSGSGGKGRGKPVVRTSPGTNASQGTTKADAANQTKSNVHHATMIMQQQANATNNTGNSMAIQPSQQQPGVVLGTERPIMPVVSMGGVGAINSAIIGNQMVGGTPQVQAMPILAQPSEVPAPPQDNASTPMVVASDRNQATEGSVVLQQNCATEEARQTPKKEEEAKEASAPSQDESKQSAKEETAAKTDDKLSNNPLVNLANAVNSITNGITDEPANAVSTPTSSGKQALPKALVKPQVLTHVIEGFVIQEASEPFAVNRSTLNGSVTQESNLLNRNNNINEKDSHEEPPRKKHTANYSNENETMSKCEACGNNFDEHTSKFKKDKRFCSSICAKSKKRETRDREAADKQWTDMDVDSKKDDPAKKIVEEKSVNEVCDFIRNLPGCSDYAEDFAIQEIDGQALMLLKEDHLMSAMSIKLGPALKIVAKIDSMRIDNSVSTSPSSNSS